MNQPPRVPEPDPSTRRDFLSKAAAVAGAAALAGCKATGEPAAGATALRGPTHAPLGADETIRMGLIGTGGMGDGHLDAFLGFRESSEGKAPLEKVEIVALADVCKPRLDRAIAKCSERQAMAVAGFRDYRELLARDDIHCVLVSTPEHWHAQMAIDAIAAGKDVYVEKPMTLRLKEALRLRRFAAANDAIVQVGTQYMLIPKYEEARRLIAEGAIGHPTLSQTSYCRNSKTGEWNYYEVDPAVVPGEMLDWDAWCGPLGPQEWDTLVYHRWRRYRRYSTGIIGDLLVHVMTPLMMALDCGWPVRVNASGGHYIDKAMDNHDQVFLTVEFENEHTMIVAGSTCNETGLETLIRGHKANLYLGGNNVVMRPERIWVDEVEEKTIECPGIAEHDAIRLDWLRSVRTREPNKSTVEFATRMMVIVDLATRSMWEGSAFSFDPESQTTKRI